MSENAAQYAPGTAANPLEGFGRPLIAIALGIGLGFLRLQPELDVTLLWWLAVTLKFVGLLTLARRAYGEHTRAIRLLAIGLMAFECVASVVTLAQHVPGMEALLWLGYLGIASLVLMASLEFAMSRYCRMWKLDGLANTWNISAWLWVALMIGGATALLVRAELTGHAKIKFDSFPPFAVLSCVWLAPVGVFMMAALSTREAERKMRGGCVKCGFDLRGLHDPICPECGQGFEISRLTLAAPTQRGRSVPWRMLVAVALVSAGLSAATYWQMPGVVSAARKPMWLLTRDAVRVVEPERASIADRDARWLVGLMGKPEGESKIECAGTKEAQQELLARIMAGSISTTDAKLIAETALRVQADRARPMGMWGDVMDALAVNGLTTSEQNLAFFIGSMPLELRVRPKVVQGGVLALEAFCGWRGTTARGAIFPSAEQASQTLSIDWTLLACEGQPLTPLPPPQESPSGSRSAGWVWSVRDSRWQLNPRDALPRVEAMVGRRNIQAKLTMHWRRSGVPSVWIPVDTLVAHGFPLEWTVSVSTATEVLPEGASATTLVEDPVWSEQIASGSLHLVISDTFMELMWSSWGRNAAVPIVANVRVNVDGEVVELGTVFTTAEGACAMVKIDPHLGRRIYEHGLASAIISPSMAEADRFPQDWRIWGGPETTVPIQLPHYTDGRPPPGSTRTTPAPSASRSSPPAPSPDQQRR